MNRFSQSQPLIMISSPVIGGKGCMAPRADSVTDFQEPESAFRKLDLHVPALDFIQRRPPPPRHMSEQAHSVKTTPLDPRFPNTNQAQHCWTRYNEWALCLKNHDRDEEPCRAFRQLAKSICPDEWVREWFSQGIVLFLFLLWVLTSSRSVD